MIVMSWGRIKGLREHHDAMYKVYCERICYFIRLLKYYFPNFEPSTWKTCFDEDTKVWSGMTWTQCVPFCGLCAALCAIHILLLVCFIFGHYRKHIVPHWKWIKNLIVTSAPQYPLTGRCHLVDVRSGTQLTTSTTLKKSFFIIFYSQHVGEVLVSLCVGCYKRHKYF